MVTTTTTYSFKKPTVGDDEDVWGGYLNDSMDLIDDVLDGTTPVTGIDINSGTIDNVVIGGATPAAGTFTTLTANTSITGTLATAAQPNITSVGTLTSLTVSGDVSFGDNDKAIFGAGSDLQIYHDGSGSFVDDQGTGGLILRGTNLFLRSSTNENYLGAVADGAVTIYHDNAQKLATTSTGVDITGNIAVSGTVDGRDVAADGTKLDGIESGATADQTANEILTAIKTVDGSGSGLDADLWDGNQFSSYLNQSVRTDAYPSFFGLNINGNINDVTNIYLASAIYHTGDTDTYISFGTNNINFRCGGVEHIEFNTSGVFIQNSALHEDYDSLSGTSVTIDPNTGGAWSLTMSGNTTFTFGSTTSGYSVGLVVELTGNGSTVTWPSSVNWAGGTAPDAPASGETDIYVFWTRNGGTTWYGVQSIDAAA